MIGLAYWIAYRACGLDGCADMHLCGYAARRDTVIGHEAF